MIMPTDYSWTAHFVSESAAQGVEGAWLARLGFFLFGMGVLWLAPKQRGEWGRWATRFHRSFGVFMIAAAVFSTRPWDPRMPYDPTEDLLHSIAATGLGFSFTFGVVAIVIRRMNDELPVRWFDGVAIAAMIALPLGIVIWTDLAGGLQRLIFIVAYVWYGRETVSGWMGGKNP